jgi:hypothetical protein
MDVSPHDATCSVPIKVTVATVTGGKKRKICSQVPI